MTFIDGSMKRHNLVTICDTTEHTYPSNSAKEGLIYYSIFIKADIFLYFKCMHSV